MVKPMVMEEVHSIVEGCSHVENRRRAVVCMCLQGPHIDLGQTEVMKDPNKAVDRVIFLV